MKHGKTFAGNTRHGGNWSYKEYEIFPPLSNLFHG